MRSKKPFVSACLLCVALQLLSACTPATAAPTVPPPTLALTGAPTIAPTTAAATGEVSWMVLADPEQIQAFQAVATAFEARNPGAKVNLASAADNEENYHAALGTAMAGGNPSDVVNLDYDATSQYAAAGGLQSLSDDIAHSTVIHATDFYTQAWDEFLADAKALTKGSD